jgi:hypothetical protein
MVLVELRKLNFGLSLPFPKVSHIEEAPNQVGTALCSTFPNRDQIKGTCFICYNGQGLTTVKLYDAILSEVS